MEIVWLPKAIEGLDVVIEYLENNWTEKQINELENDIQELLYRIKNYSFIGQPSGKNPHIRKAYPNKLTYLIYRVNQERKVIEIVNFRSTKQKPI